MGRFICAGAFSLALIGTAGAQFYDPPSLANRNGRLGLQFYMLEVPNPGSMVADARNTDWGWYDPEYILTMDEWRDEADRPIPERDDYNITTLMGWKGAPENRWYVYMEIVDDTLSHWGNNVEEWNADMIEFGLDPTDHGRDFPNGWTMEYIARPGDLVPPRNYRYRWSGPEAWLENNEAPQINFAVRTDPPEAFAAEMWTTGGTTYYEWNYVVKEFMEDGGPSASNSFDLNAVAGEDGAGIGFALWAEDGEGGNPSTLQNDMTTRGPEASARQYYSHAKLLRSGEYATAVESSTWGNIKHTFK
jgi:hypothetical protein